MSLVNPWWDNNYKYKRKCYSILHLKLYASKQDLNQSRCVVEVHEEIEKTGKKIKEEEAASYRSIYNKNVRAN